MSSNGFRPREVGWYKPSPRPSTTERFWSKVDRRGSDECWPWLGTAKNRSPRDYGMFWFEGRHRPAHVVAWELTNGPMPAGMMGCHTCDNPRCVNPAHVFPGTMSDNIRDAVSKGRITHAGTDTTIREGVCKRGHRLDDWNIYVRPDGGRTCRACRDEKHREWLAAHPGPHR